MSNAQNGVTNDTHGEDIPSARDQSTEKEKPSSSNEDALFHIKDGLTQLEKTLSGDGYAFSNLTCKNKNLNCIPKEIEKYKHLKYINMSHNKIEDIDKLYSLSNVVFLDMSNNMIKTIKKLASNCLKNCVYMNLSHNLIKKVEDIKMQNLRELDLSHNNIENMNINLPSSVKKLNLSNNNIKTLALKNKLDNLESIDLSSNPIENIEFSEIAPNINYLKINNNSTMPMSQLSNLNNFKELHQLDMDNYLHFKDISYKEIKQILEANTKDIDLQKFNGNRIDKQGAAGITRKKPSQHIGCAYIYVLWVHL
ncbi:leucine-rich repeat protein [Plasmodium cynomolgi strain B]|uniref:Leucine-rich repeat protein n=1 Tax=Plasmodium cynomolgi (strain B) TaxID=1120755 RepID=K6UWG7_PLACD|nr:leucine-rich repeat protein [Plasmodium cynomolgi strain B]GAB66735.1 leucine-rich repeat protein [Plasmodium cynomolgi strain B]